MRSLIILSVFFTSQNLLASDDVDKIPLILPVSYDRTPLRAQNERAGSTVWLGDLIGKANIEDKIDESLAPYKSDLGKYFPGKGEFDNFVNRLVAEANSTIVNGEMTDDKLIIVNHFFGNRLVGEIYNRILAKEGVENVVRRKIWVKKLLAPFNNCISHSSNGYYAANACMDTLTKSLLPNVGLGLVYEMSKDKLSSGLPVAEQFKFNSANVQLYRNCLPKSEIKTSEVLDCTLKAMKSGVLKVSDGKLTPIIKDSSSGPNAATAIKNQVWTPFNQCIQDVTVDGKPINDQFMTCLDSLVQKTGVALVKDKITNTAALKAQFSKNELDKLAEEKADFFKKCTDTVIEKNIRKDGMIDIQNCQDRVTNEVTYKVVLGTFNSNAETMLKGQPDNIANVIKSGKQALDSCWKSDLDTTKRDSCIKSSVITFSKQIASSKLDNAIPDSTPKKDELLTSSLNSLGTCLQKNLPANISEATNTTEKLTECSDKLTKNVAVIVGEAQVKAALDGKMPPNEVNAFIAKVVKKDFATCIGNKPTDKQLDGCSDKLKITVSDKVLDQNIGQYLGDRPGIDLSKMRSDIKNKLLNDFKSCLSTNKDKDSCTDTLFKKANQTIVLSFGRTEASVQLNTDKVPSKLDPIEEQFTKCTTTELRGNELSKHLDDCNKQFAIEFARVLGNLKLNYLLEKALGSKTLVDEKALLDKITKSYNSCLDDLYQYKMADHLTDKITICTKQLENQAMGVVRSNLTDWMSSSEKDATAIAVKESFANMLPCLSSLLPASPYDPSMEGNVDSILKPVAQIMAQYIDYNPENARSNLNDVIKKLSEDLKSTGGTDKAKSELLDLLYKNGALDQFIKSIVRGKVKEAFAGISDSDIPKDLKESLLARDNFEKIFNSEDGKKIKDFALQNLLKPMLLENATMKSPLVSASADQINDKVTQLLVNSPRFGEVIIKKSVQKQIDEMGFFSRAAAKMLYGSANLNWENVRNSPNGVAAEKYIRENILMPKFKGQKISEKEEKKINEKAKDLVTEAVKKYKAP